SPIPVPQCAHLPLASVLHANAASPPPVAPRFPHTALFRSTFSGGALGAPPSAESGFYATSGTTAALGAQAGAYSFSAAFAGDNNYNALTAGTHNPANFLVGQRTLNLTTHVPDASHRPRAHH